MRQVRIGPALSSRVSAGNARGNPDRCQVSGARSQGRSSGSGNRDSGYGGTARGIQDGGGKIQERRATYGARETGNPLVTCHCFQTAPGSRRRISETWSKSESTLIRVLNPLRNIVATCTASRTESRGYWGRSLHAVSMSSRVTASRCGNNAVKFSANFRASFRRPRRASTDGGDGDLSPSPPA